jgi:hypothetical protein
MPGVAQHYTTISGRKRWVAHVTIRSHQMYLGTFDSENDANRAVRYARYLIAANPNIIHPDLMLRIHEGIGLSKEASYQHHKRKQSEAT